jgi:predicted O-methyltransferase YrrM
LVDIADRLIPEIFKPPARTVFQWIQINRFTDIKHEGNGMLAPEEYKLLYHYSQDVAEWNMLEIGAGHGASTISLALGIRESESDSRLFTFEKGEGGSRDRYGDKETNIRILRNNLREFEVSKHVQLLTQRLTRDGGVPDTVRQAAPFGLIFIDADGQLDRDFELLYELLLPGGLVIVDDYNPTYNNEKSLQTFALINLFKEKGLLIERETYSNLFVGHKPIQEQSVHLEEAEISDIEDRIKELSAEYC